MPALGLAAAVTLLEHMVVPHKEVRFIYLAIAAAPILIGLGLTEMVCAIRTRLDERFAVGSTAAILAANCLPVWWTATETLEPALWQAERASTLLCPCRLRETRACANACHSRPVVLAVRWLHVFGPGCADLVWFSRSGTGTFIYPDNAQAVAAIVLQTGDATPQTRRINLALRPRISFPHDRQPRQCRGGYRAARLFP